MNATYTISAVKTFQGMDGQGFNANINRDGKKVALAIDEGCGGGYLFHFDDRSEHDAFDAFCADWLTKNPPRYLGLTEKQIEVIKAGKNKVKDSWIDGPEEWISRELDRHETIKRMKRTLARTTIFVVKGSDNLKTMKGPRKGREGGHAHFIKEKYPDATILNDLPIEEAMPILVDDWS